MKQIWNGLRIGVLLVLLVNILPGRAIAAEQVELKLHTEQQTIDHHENVTVAVKATADFSNRGLGITLFYDGEVLQPDKSEAMAPFAVYGPMEVDGKTALRISCFPQENTINIGEGKTVAKIDFLAIAPAAAGTKLEMGQPHQYEPTVEVVASEQGLNLTVNPVPVTSISLDQTQLLLENNMQRTLTATVGPEEASNKDVIWSSSNDSVATVSQDGKVKTVAAGSAVITARAKDNEAIYATCEVTVTRPNDAGYKVRMPVNQVSQLATSVYISPVIRSQEQEVYNAYAFTFTYDPRYLKLLNNREEFKKDGIEMLVSEVSDTEHQVELLRYGADVSLNEDKSTPFMLEFYTLMSGETEVKLVEARVDHSANALVRNAALAEPEDDTTKIMMSGYGVTYPQPNLFNGPGYIMAGSDLEFTAKSSNHQYCFEGTSMDGVTKIWYEFLDEKGQPIADSQIHWESNYVQTDIPIQDVVIHLGNADRANEAGRYVYHGPGGRFIILDVNGPVEINATSEGKFYQVTRRGSAPTDAFTGSAKAQYGVDYILTQQKQGSFNLVLEGLGSDATFRAGMDSISGKTIYTLPGQYITGDFTITINGEASGGGGDNTDPSEPDSSDPTQPSIPQGHVSVTAEGSGIVLVGGSTALLGEDYTFRLANDDVFDYTLKVTIGTRTRTNKVTYDEKEDLYTIPGEWIDGNILIEAEPRTQFDVTVSGTGKSEVEAEETATYGTDFSFKLTKKTGYTYTVTVTIGGKAYTKTEVEDDIYIIDGEDILGDITIKVVRTKTSTSSTTDKTTSSAGKTTSTTKKQATVIFEGSGAGDAAGEATTTQNQAYTFKVNEQSGYVYKVSAAVGGKAVAYTFDKNTGEYTIAAKNVTGNLVITIEKTKAVEVNQYLTLDGRSLFLVAYHAEVAKGDIPKYDGNPMYWSETYGAYVWLIESTDTDEKTEARAALKTAVVKGATGETVNYSGNVDGSMAMDLSDARMVLDMYRGKYDLSNLDMQKLLSADVNGDGMVNLQDVRWIAARILEQEEGGRTSE